MRTTSRRAKVGPSISTQRYDRAGALNARWPVVPSPTTPVASAGCTTGERNVEALLTRTLGTTPRAMSPSRFGVSIVLSLTATVGISPGASAPSTISARSVEARWISIRRLLPNNVGRIVSPAGVDGSPGSVRSTVATRRPTHTVCARSTTWTRSNTGEPQLLAQLARQYRPVRYRVAKHCNSTIRSAGGTSTE